MDNLTEDSNQLDIIQPHIEWTPEHENILIEWADKAMCYRWLHSKSNLMYGALNAWYTIPVIIISTLTGTGNFAQGRIPIEHQSLFVMIIGGFNLLAGIITTIQQFLKITQLNEAHRVSSIAWDKFYRNIRIELSKHPSERIDPKQMLKMNKEEFDRLNETSPTIPEKIVNRFKLHFLNHDTYDKIIKPEICDILVPTADYRNPWYTEENRAKDFNESMKVQLAKVNKQKKQNEMNIKQVHDFIKLFNDLNNRKPMETEIIDNLKEKINIQTIKTILEENRSIYIKVNPEENNVLYNMV